VEDQLQRLLEAEARAQAVVDDASQARKRLIEDALATARDAEARFDAGKTELREPFLKEAQVHAEQEIAELTRRHEERQRTLRDLASRHETEAVEAALTLLLDPSV
jgi:V/A-type H+-transporting ATPase subunit G/H